MDGEQMASRLLLVRHGETDSNAAGRLAGATDNDLSDIGRSQVQRLPAILRSYNIERCFSSPLKRAVQTAEVAGLKVELDADLREIDFGLWENLTFQEVSDADSKAAEAWLRFDPDFTFPNGERIGDFVDRAKRVANRLAELPDKTVLVVAHGGVITAMLNHLLRLPTQGCWCFDIRHAVVTVVNMYDDAGVLTGLNLGMEGQ